LASGDNQSNLVVPEYVNHLAKLEKPDLPREAEPPHTNILATSASLSSDDRKASFYLPVAGDDQLASPANLSQLIDQAPVINNWTAWPNEVFDKVLPHLKPQDQVVLLRLYRLSRGFKSDTCLVTINKLASSCNISGREVYRSIERLEAKGLVKRISVDFNNKNLHERGTTFKVYLPIVTTARQTGGNKQSPPVKQSPADHMSDIKYINTKDTLTNTSGRTSNASPSQEDIKRNVTVGVSSRFNLEDCQRYAQHLHKTGQGITNPGGYATTIYRTGEADELIKKFLHPPAPPASVDASQCKHERLASKVQEGAS
jgi:DNA-binding Lrp family transcriptional regulator